MSNPKQPYAARAIRARRGISVGSALWLRVAAAVAIIAAAAFVAYLPCLNGGFIWDDHTLVTESNLIKGSDGLLRFWCTTDPIDYWPVTNTAFWIEWRLWEMNPAGYHVANVILHIVEALLIWIVLRKLFIPGAFLAAMIFTLHPVNVESVAWITQQKNLMAMLFFLLSILWYLSFLRRAPLRVAAKQSTADNPRSTADNPLPAVHGYTWYWLSLAAFALAMLSKGSVAVLPVLLIGIVWWLNPAATYPITGPRKTGLAVYTWRHVAPIVPFFLLAAGLTMVNMRFQTAGLEEAIRVAGFMQRLLGAGCVVWFYLEKAIWPINLSFVYTNWDIQPGNFLWWLPLLATLGVTALLWRYRRSWSRPLLFAWGFFCVALLPVMGFSDVFFMRYALVADHYQHIAIIAAIALAAALWRAWHRLAAGWIRGAAAAAAIAALGALSILTWEQSGQYRDEFTLYSDTMNKSPDCWMAHINLGKALIDAGRLQDATGHFRQALRIKSDCIEAYNNLGNVFVQTNRPLEALEYYRQALSFKPDYTKALNNLGNALNELGRHEEAAEYCQRALSIDPNFHEAWFNLGNAFLHTGRPGEAMGYYRRALALKPDYPQAHNNLGSALNQTGRAEEAVEHFETALSLKPDFAEARLNLGNALFNLGRVPESIEQYKQALVLKPDFAQAHNNLGGALCRMGRRREAIEHFRESARLKPSFTDAYYNLALTYADMHQSSEAVAMAKKALELARSQGQTVLAKQIEELLNSSSAASPELRKGPAEGASAPH